MKVYTSVVSLPVEVKEDLLWKWISQNKVVVFFVLVYKQKWDIGGEDHFGIV